MNKSRNISDEKRREALKKLNIGIRYSKLKEHIAESLEEMYNDYKQNGVIESLTNYENENMTRTYLRKLAEIGIISGITSSKKNMQYVWTGTENPDFEELAIDLLTKPKPKETLGIISTNQESFGINSAKLVILLTKNGVPEDKIPKLAQEIMKIFYP